MGSPVAKRLYRFLDKRFYHGPEVSIDLHELAFRKLRLSESYNTAQIKRVLLKGIAELESLWELRATNADRRFRKLSNGHWEAVFVKKKPRQPRPGREAQRAEEEQQSLEVALTKRGIGPAAAAELVAGHPRDRIQTMIELHDWHNNRGQERGTGFIVAGIRSKDPYSWPKGFKPSQRNVNNSRICPVREKRERTKATSNEKDNSQLGPFLAFWEKLDPEAQSAFEQQAMDRADPIKRRWYDDARVGGRDTAGYFRLAILNDLFQRTGGDTINSKVG